MNYPLTDEQRATLLNQETARIAWRDLQSFYAQGRIVRVAPDADLVAVAAAMANDNASLVSAWIDAGALVVADDQAAARWQASDAVLWCVVVAPWVLVQEIH